jgi:hypothetical protein
MTIENAATAQAPPVEDVKHAPDQHALVGKPLISQPVPASPERVNQIVATGEQKTSGVSTAVGPFASDVHNHVWTNLVYAEQKSAFLFAAITGVLAYLHSRGATRRWFVGFHQWRLPELLAFLAVFGLVFAGFCVILVVLPRLKGSSTGIVYWKAIASFPSASDYSDRVINSEPGHLDRAKLEHCYELSKICDSKFRFVKVGMWSGSVGLFAAILYIGFF